MPEIHERSLVFVAIVLATAGCKGGWEFECRDGEPYLNGRAFDCSVCYEEQGCTLEGSVWECPPSAELSCSTNDLTGEYCCGDDCITCDGSSTPQVCDGYSGSDTECCRDDDPCGLQRNGSCDCDGACGWDGIDCEGLSVDVLLVMDNSMSMAEEQLAFTEAFRPLIEDLLTPADGSTPVGDLHLGVVSTDMGTGGYEVASCTDPVDGDDGVLLHVPSPDVSGCDAAYPAYLAYESDTPDPGQADSTMTGFDCIANLGTDGCGWEQHLAAARRAVEHSTAGGPNEGFLRTGSILVIVFVTDEEDCSVSQPEIFDVVRTDLGPFGLRCMLNEDMVHPVTTYVETFQGLRSDPDFLVLGVLAGVPADPACEGHGDEIGSCLDHPMMDEEPDPSDPTRILPSCNYATGIAYPPRRLVEVAQAFGHGGVVGSICTDDYTSFVSRLYQRIRWVIDG